MEAPVSYRYVKRMKEKKIIGVVKLKIYISHN